MAIDIAYVYNHSGKGGGSSQARTLLEAFTRRDELAVTAVHAADTNVPEHVLDESGSYPVLWPSTVEGGLRELDPDVVFVHGYGPPLNARLRDLKEEGDLDAAWVMRYGANLFEAWSLGPMRAGTDGNVSKNDIKHITDHVLGFKWYDCLICPSQAAAERCQHYYGDDTPRLAHIPNGIKTTAYAPSSFMLNDTLSVLTVSRAGPNDFLMAPIWAVARLAGDYPIELTVLGAGHAANIGAVKHITEQVDAISYGGYVDNDRVRTHMEMADVVCVPSVSQQAVPLAALEGMAAGNVVLCGSFQPAYEEEALIRVPTPHPPAWHDALEDVFADPEDAVEWQQKGIENAKGYDVSKIVEAGYIPVFEGLVG